MTTSFHHQEHYPLFRLDILRNVKDYKMPYFHGPYDIYIELAMIKKRQPPLWTTFHSSICSENCHKQVNKHCSHTHISSQHHRNICHWCRGCCGCCQCWCIYYICMCVCVCVYYKYLPQSKNGCRELFNLIVFCSGNN